MVFPAKPLRLVGDTVEVLIELLQNCLQLLVQLVIQFLLFSQLVHGLRRLSNLLLVGVVYQLKLIYGLEVQLADILFHVVHFDVKNVLKRKSFSNSGRRHA